MSVSLRMVVSYSGHAILIPYNGNITECNRDFRMRPYFPQYSRRKLTEYRSEDIFYDLRPFYSASVFILGKAKRRL